MPHASSTTVQTVAAVMSGWTEALIFTPLERVQTLLQQPNYKNRFKNTSHVFRELFSLCLQEYYRGFFTIFLRNVTGSVLYYLFKDRIKAIFPETTSANMSCIQDFVSGGLLGGIVSTVWYPRNVIK